MRRRGGGGRKLVSTVLLLLFSAILLSCCIYIQIASMQSSTTNTNHYHEVYNSTNYISDNYRIGQNHRRLLDMAAAVSSQTQQIPQQQQQTPQQQQQQQQHITPQQHLQQLQLQLAIQKQQIGKTVEGPSVRINMMRRAKDVVSSTDVPFLLQIPHTSSETIYNIMTQCYGLVGKQYTTPKEIEHAKSINVVDNYYVNSHDRPVGAFKNFGERFHFLATPHYQEGTGLLTLKHKGRVVLLLRHPCVIAESMYLSRPNVVQGKHIPGLVQWVNSTNYYDNWMTRMLANVPPNVEVTEEHFRNARMILENKFLIGMTENIEEMVKKRLALYFGWKETKEGCEDEMIQKGISSIPPSSLVEGGDEWRFIRLRNHYDMKLYARGCHVSGDLKMRVPVHPLIRRADVAVVEEAFSHLRNVKDERDSADLPFFWHIPKASGTTVKEVLSNCYNLIRTEMIRPPSSLDVNRKKNVLNLDLTTPASVVEAIQLKVADRGLADVFVSQLSLEGSTVFSEYHMGRAFTIMRHPVKLAASLFYYRRIATWEPTYRPDYKSMTLQQYVEVDGYYDNWIVRMITRAKLGGLNDSHLELAKRIIKDKFIIGISDHMDETFRILEIYYGWKEKKEGCVNFHLHSAPSNKNKYNVPADGGRVWNLIAEKNKYDMALYQYALEIFAEQSQKYLGSRGPGSVR